MYTDIIHVDPQFLSTWNRPVPRYTSYPTAPQFYPLDASILQQKLSLFAGKEKSLSLYIHIPFCKTMCLFCGCSVILNRNPDRQERYLQSLFKEIELTAPFPKRTVSQLHLGGGTPTSLTEEQFDRLILKLKKHFHFAPNAEISIEIDPRTVYADQGSKLAHLKNLGFNRVSFGVQDLDQTVQEAIRRRQTEEMTISTYYKARELGFSGINIDLIYGLPLQTTRTFEKTASKIIELKPDRIALYSYAKVPWLKAHQKAIPDETLPSTEEKFHIYTQTRAAFMQGGYTAIGMDHFSLKDDPISQAYREKKLTRNFQGYSIDMAEDMLGLGLSSIGYLENCYFQNTKTLDEYHALIEDNKLPLSRGYILTQDDLIRKNAILSLMCHFEISKKYAHLADLSSCVQDGFLTETSSHYIATPLGRLFIRLIAAKFDSYLTKGKFSNAV
jgi:oxygen-independent coproporphyrinogen-3 oxidase